MKRFLSGSRLLWLLGICLTVSVFLASCHDDDDHVRPKVAGLMAFNLAPDKPVVGVALSGNELNPLPYMSYTGGYLAVFPGKRYTESYDAATGESLAVDTPTYQPDKYYSLFVTGMGDAFYNIVVEDGLDSLSGQAGKSYIRYINAIPGSGSPAVTVSNGKGELISDHPAFNTVSDFTAIDTGAITIDVNDGGDIHTSRTIAVEERKVYTLLLTGHPAGTGNDSVQIRYIPNAMLTLDSTADNAPKAAE
ncbi:DUF4397 domain-containing protein [Compostibacter hankyongensis]|uniref:DUF4397 domain-containing protein n=1 Tax=Compostibacter hankyongensis TaxID=1007089 RepID=A0ABP8FFK1_9BACT